MCVRRLFSAERNGSSLTKSEKVAKAKPTNNTNEWRKKNIFTLKKNDISEDY